MFKVYTGFSILILVGSTLSSVIDIFEATNGHEPRVAIKCGKVPFHVDLVTGAWVSDSNGKAACDKNKEKVKKYCQKAYPKLNITNIVEANKPVKFNNWCKPGKEQCDISKKVVPYRCLVNEYEADALMVPNGCKFDHIHDQSLCLTHDHWRKKAAKECNMKYSMKLKDYGILLSCKTDLFTGVEFVCCPKKQSQKKHAKKFDKVEPTKASQKEEFSAAIRNFQKFLPLETKGCDRSTYITKQTKMEDRHRNQIAAVVDEWDDAEKRYNQLKEKDPKAAEEKMKRTLEVFRTTLAALEDESKQEKGRLRAEHADCINTQIAKNKRDAMIAYLAAIEETPASKNKTLKALRKFIQVCEHDRVHSLRHFEHVRNRDATKAETLRGELLQHLKDLNKVVNESMGLLNYLPEISQQFGITGSIGGAILKPRLQMPVDKHTHEKVHKIKNSETYKTLAKKQQKPEPSEKSQGTLVLPTDDIPTEPEPFHRVTTNFGSVSIKPVDKVDDDKEMEHDDDEDENEEEKEQLKIDEALQAEFEEHEKREDHKHEMLEERVEEHEEEGHKEKNIYAELMKLKKDVEKKDKDKHQSPFAFNAIMGLACGVLVIMLFVVIAMVMRRRRLVRTRVVLAENNDDREHLVQMQKNGFENPTYKFYYY